LIACALLSLAVIPALGQDPKEPLAATSRELSVRPKKTLLVGSWATKITPPAASGVPAFPGFFTFDSDGNLVATQSGGEFPALGNPQIGLWEYGGGTQFTITYFVQDFDDHFQQVGSEEEHATVTVDGSGDHFTGIVDINVFDLDGNLLFSDCCATFEGRRLNVRAPQPQSQSVSQKAVGGQWSAAGARRLRDQ
jgi:hypothetical protein